MKKIIVLLLITVAVACKKKSSTPAPEMEKSSIVPDKAILLAPATNATCFLGRFVSPTESAVTFTWNSALNASGYSVVVKNLLIGTTANYTASATQLEITLLRNTPYSWYVVSKSSANTSTAQSDTWKFYNAGQGTSSYAPFPAELLLPAYNQQVAATGGKVTLDWNGLDVDNDLTAYDVYFGTGTTNLLLLRSSLTESMLTDVVVLPGSTYYWKVLARDSKGNTSASEIYVFKVN